MPRTICNRPCCQAFYGSIQHSNTSKKMVMENAVIVFCKRGCCMSVVVERLLQALGVNPVVFEVDKEMEGEVVAELESFVINKDDNNGENNILDLNAPAVFVGGKFFGGVERVLAAHITGDLVPVLKDAGALWL